MFKAIDYSEKHFGSLIGLLSDQAEHHGVTFGGDLAKLRDEFGEAGGHNQAFFIKHDSEAKPVGLAVVHELYTPDGKGLYLEDLYIAEEFRNSVRGTGSYAFGHLIEIARKKNYDFVNWLVASDNDEHTFRFYTDKCQAQPEPYNMLSLSKKFDYAASPEQTRYAPMVETLGTGSYRLSLHDTQGEEVAAAYLTQNFSTFRTVTGFRVEPDLPVHEDHLANDNARHIHEALHLSIIDFAKKSDNTGHIAYAIPKDQPEFESYLRSVGLDDYCLDEREPATKLLPFRITRAEIESDLMERLQRKPLPQPDDKSGLNNG